ncbi:MAG TPA: hypothetical protein VLV83_08175 [Acidobacteriota bacterium]|nr:hypothetical protein [Acidobacteriota bacterium]
MPKMSDARRALRKAGLSKSAAQHCMRLIDLDKDLDPQIAEIQEDLPELFATDEEDNPSEDDRPMTTAEATMSRLEGRTGPGAGGFKTPHKPRTSNVSEASQKTAEYLRKSVNTNPPPVYPRNLGSLNPAATAERAVSETAQRAAEALRGKSDSQ